MQYTSIYNSPIGNILLASDDIGLIGAWFEGEKYYAQCLEKDTILKDTIVIKKVKLWLDKYFQGKNPDINFPIHLIGTPFQIEVWKCLQKIPYGSTTTYSEIAKEIARQKGISRMSAQAVGTAIGKNNLPIILPCHRVISTKNSLSGYSGGLDKKVFLLKLENSFSDKFIIQNKPQ